jgi:hypothetical protein
VLRIEPLGTGVILPAFVVGYELSEESDARVCELDGSFPWMLTLYQQAGGYCMSYPIVFGCVLRFSDNAHRCRSNLGKVVRGFQAMAEDPNLKLLRSEYTALVTLVYTRGDNYDSEQLKRLKQYLELFFDIPPLESGIEAFVRMVHCDPMSYFAGWRMLSAIPKTEPRQLYRGQSDTYIDESNLDAIHLTADVAFSEETVLALRDAGRQLRVDHLRVFLLWENSD